MYSKRMKELMLDVDMKKNCQLGEQEEIQVGLQ